MENQITMSYKKTSIKKINLDTYKVEVHDRNEPLSYYPDYTQVRGYNIQLYGPYETQTTTLTKNSKKGIGFVCKTIIRREYHVFIFIICHPSTASYSNLNEKAIHFTDYLSETEAVLPLQLQFYFPLF